jgi:hypothetical protein
MLLECNWLPLKTFISSCTLRNLLFAKIKSVITTEGVSGGAVGLGTAPQDGRFLV